MNRRVFGLGVMVAGASACAGGPEKQGAGPVGEADWFYINGYQQWITMRGEDARNPVLLWVHGGPGIAMSPYSPMFREWERDFTVVMWDQPSSGGTGVRNLANQGELSLDRYAKDGIAVAEMLRTRFGKRKIALVGISWGTRLGVEMVNRRPDLFSIYVGTAQVTGARGARMGYDMALMEQRDRGNAAGVKALESAGPPPYDDFNKLLVRQQFTNPPGHPMTSAEAAKSAASARLMAAHPLEQKYVAYPVPPPGFVPARDGMQMFLDTVKAVMMREQSWEIRDYGRNWPIPMFVFQGENDFNAPVQLAREWVAEIKAPNKAYETILGAGHNTTLFHEELLALMRKHEVMTLAAQDR